MADWKIIPASKRQPGKLLGGHWVVLQAWTAANHWAVGMLGEDGAKITGGYGGWEQTEVPRSLAITDWTAQPNMEMTLDLLFDGWPAHPIAPKLPAAFTGAPHLPTGVKFQPLRGSRPVGQIARTKTKRPLPPASKPPHAGVIKMQHRPLAPASKPPLAAVQAASPRARPLPPASKPPAAAATAKPSNRPLAPVRSPTSLKAAFPAPQLRTPPAAVVRADRAISPPQIRQPPAPNYQKPMHGRELPPPRWRVPRKPQRHMQETLQPPQIRKPAKIKRHPQAGLHPVEQMLANLESLAIRQPGDPSPHSVRLFGAVPHTEKRWVITNLEWGDEIRDHKTGRRIRARVTVTLLEFHHPAVFNNLPRGKAGENRPVQVPRSR